MKTNVIKLTADADLLRKKLILCKAALRHIKYHQLAELVPNFSMWYGGHFRPESASPVEPLFIGIAYTETKRGKEGNVFVTLDNDGTLHIRPLRRYEYGIVTPYEDGIEK